MEPETGQSVEKKDYNTIQQELKQLLEKQEKENIKIIEGTQKLELQSTAQINEPKENPIKRFKQNILNNVLPFLDKMYENKQKTIELNQSINK